MDGRQAALWFRGQSAIEFLSTYSWALLILALVLAAAAILSLTAAPSNYVPATCYISPLFPCQGTLLTAYGSASAPITYQIIFTNNLNNPIYLGSNSFNAIVSNLGSQGQGSYAGSCTPSFALPGAQIFCRSTISGTYEPSIGSMVNTLFIISYQLCTSSSSGSCGSITYKTSGYATQSLLTPYSSAAYAVNVITQVWSTNTIDSGPGGFVRISGNPYSNNAQVLLFPSTYEIFGQPPSGDSLAYFAVNSPSYLAALAPSGGNTTLTLNANTVLEAAFTTAKCDTPYSGFAPLCPSSCPTLLTTKVANSAQSITLVSDSNEVSGSAPVGTLPTFTTANTGSTSLSGTSTQLSFASGGGSPVSMSIDGSNAIRTSANTVTATLSTANANDIIIVYSGISGSSVVTLSISDTSHLSWSVRQTETATLGTNYEWYALASSALTNDQITVASNTATTGNLDIVAFGVSGANTVSPFDPNSALPTNTVDSSSTTTGNVAITTSNANDMIIVMGAVSSTPTSFSSTTMNIIAQAAGSRAVIAGNAFVTSTKSAAVYGFSWSSSNTWVFFGDALKEATSSPSTTYNSYFFASGGQVSNSVQPTVSYSTYGPDNALYSQQFSNYNPETKVTTYGLNFSSSGNSPSSAFTTSLNVISAQLGTVGLASNLLPSNLVAFASNGVNGNSGTTNLIVTFSVPAAGYGGYILGSASSASAGVLPTLPAGCQVANYISEGGSTSFAANCVFASYGSLTANWLVTSIRSLSMSAWVFSGSSSPFTISISPALTNNGQTVSLTSSLSLPSSPTYQWYSNTVAGTCGSSWTAISGATSSSYSNSPASTTYYCLGATFMGSTAYSNYVGALVSNGVIGTQSSSTSFPSTTTIGPVATGNTYSCNTCTLPIAGYSCPSSCPNFVPGAGCASPMYGRCISSSGGTGYSPPLTVVTIPTIIEGPQLQSTTTANICV